MRNIRILMFASVAVLALAYSCKKDDNPDTSGYTIYVVGQYYGSDGYVSCYWKNSERVDIPDMVANINVERGIFASNGDVYLAGPFLISGGSVWETKLEPSYWKNGVRTKLDMGGYTSGRADYIKVVNGKVYTAGHVVKHKGEWYEDNESKGCYWINTERIEITDIPVGAKGGSVTGLFVDGNDVYVSGVYSVSVTVEIDVGDYYPDIYTYDMPCACYWKNGVRTDIPNNSPNSLLKWRDASSRSSSIFVDNGKVYVSGSNQYMTRDLEFTNEAWYWVDGKMHIVETGSEIVGAQINNIFVEKGIIYLSGKDASGEQCYWKDNTKTKGGGYCGLHVKDGIVFTSGTRVVPSGGVGEYEKYPGYWVNTKRVELAAPISNIKWNNFALGIFVE